jgi:Ca-activated chloride channel family protein
MSFQWPWMLLLLGVVPLLALQYRRLLRRRAARRAQLAALGLVAPSEMSAGNRRHVAPVLFLAALTLLLVALARPEATVADPRREGTVILAFDISGSMAAKDLAPNRLEAAKTAAKAFVERQPPSIRVGVVAFGESALLTQRPTTDRAVVTAAITRLTPQGGTSLGRGLQTSLSAIAGKTVQLEEANGSLEVTGPDLGFHPSAAVILLTDGENTAEPDPLQVADVSSSAGVRVYPIGLGSPQGTILEIDGFQVATVLDERLLRQIAETTDGEYFPAADREALSRIYSAIPLAFTAEPRPMEVTALFSLGAAALLVIGAGLSFLWFGRVI